MKRKKVLICTAVVGVLLLGLGGGALAHFAGSKAPETAYREYQVSKGDITVGIDGTGKIVLDSTVVSFVFDSKVKEVLVLSGQTVREGDALVRFDADDLQTQYDALQTKYEKLQLQMRQLKLGHEKANVADSTSLQSNADGLQTAKNEYTRKRDALQHTIDTQRQAAESLQAELNALQQQIDAAQDDTQKQALQQTYRDKAAQRDQAQQACQQAESELAVLTANFSTEEQRYTDALVQGGKNQTLNGQEQNTQIRSLQLDLNAAKEELDAYAAFLKDPVLYAPQDGIVLDVQAKAGTVVQKDAPALSLGSSGKRSMEIQVPQSDIAKVQMDQTVDIYLEAYPDQLLAGKVESIGQKGEASGGDIVYKVSVALQSEAENVFDGMTGEATFIIKQKTDVLRLSNRAIHNDNGKQTVLRRNSDGSTEKLEIQTGFSDGRFSEILGDVLQDGDIILMER